MLSCSSSLWYITITLYWQHVNCAISYDALLCGKNYLFSHYGFTSHSPSTLHSEDQQMFLRLWTFYRMYKAWACDTKIVNMTPKCGNIAFIIQFSELLNAGCWEGDIYRASSQHSQPLKVPQKEQDHIIWIGLLLAYGFRCWSIWHGLLLSF